VTHGFSAWSLLTKQLTAATFGRWNWLANRDGGIEGNRKAP